MTAFCAICVEGTEGLELEDGVLVCQRCREEHPRAGGYDFAPVSDWRSERGRAAAGCRWRSKGRDRARVGRE